MPLWHFHETRGDCSLLRALACGRRSHTCRLRSVFSEVHTPGKNGFNLFFALRGEKSEGDSPSECPLRQIISLTHKAVYFWFYFTPRIWYNKRSCAYYIAFRSFFSPLTRQPKNVTNYTTAALRLWYNIGNIAQCGKSRFRENMRSDDGTFLKMYFVYLKKK